MTVAEGTCLLTSSAWFGPESAARRARLPSTSSEDLGHAHVGTALDALGEVHDREVIGDVRQHLPGGATDAVARGHHHDGGDALESLADLVCGYDTGRENDIGQVHRIVMRLVDTGSDLRLARPELYVDPLAAEKTRNGGPPRTGTDYRNFHASLPSRDSVMLPILCSSPKKMRFRFA